MDRGPLHTWTRLPWGLLLASLPVLLLLGVMANYYGGMVSDDAYISFRYARNLATGMGLEWNPGYRVEGYSNFLWVAALALLNLLGAPIEAAAQWLTWLSAAAAVVLIVWAGRLERAEKTAWALAALAPLPLVASFPYIWWTSMRLETAAFGMLILLTLLLFAREEADSRPDYRPWGSAIPLLCLFLIRPEGPAFAAVPVGFLVIGLRSRADLARVIQRRWRWALIWGLGFVIYQIWRVSYFGELMPNTYHAKVVGCDQFHEGWVYLRRLVNERPIYVALAGAPLLLGVLGSRVGRLLMAALTLLVVIITLEGGDWMREWRMFQPCVPIAAAAIGVGLQRAARLGWPAGLSAALGLLILVGQLHNLIGTPRSEWEAALRGERRGQLINMEGDMTRVSKDVATWLRKEAKPTDLIAVNHAGALPYYVGLPVLDMAGLNDKHIARRPGHGLIHTKWDSDYVLKQKPAFVVLNTKTYPHDFEYSPGYWQGETDLVHHPDFNRFYAPVKKVWTWKALHLAARDSPGSAGEFHIMVFRRVKEKHQRVGPCLDFESGDFTGWTASGEAFGEGPVNRRPPPGVREDFIGKWIVDSYRALDARTGVLLSDPFKLTGDRLELVIGGGGSEQVGVRVLMEGQEIWVTRGHRDHQLRHKRWDVPDEYRGKEVQIEVFDNGSEEWDHILVDNICQYKKLEEEKTEPTAAPDAGVAPDAGM